MNKNIFDLGAVAKGYIADYLKFYLIQQNINSANINLGGNCLCIGSKNFLEDFNIGIYKPFSNNEVCLIEKINDKSIVTSGIYQRYFMYNNDIYSHIIDNTTGYPIKNNLYSVSIISDLSIVGDTLSTICMLDGYDNSKNIIDYFRNKYDNNLYSIFIDDKYNISKY